METKKSNPEKHAFRSGYNQLNSKQKKEFKKELKRVMKLNTDAVFYSRLNGKVIPNIEEYKAIKDTFAKFNILIDIWGI